MIKRLLCVVTLAIVLLPLSVFAQPKYRTFTQEQLSQREDLNAGKGIASEVSFVIKNTFDYPVNAISAHLSSRILSLVDSAGFPSVKLANYNSTIAAEGKVLQPGDSVTFRALVNRKVRGTKITGYQMRMKTLVSPVTAFKSKKHDKVMGSSVAVATMTMTYGLTLHEIRPLSDIQVIAQPTGGNVIAYLYRKDIRKPAGIVLGVAKGPGGWIRTYRSDVTEFPHFGHARCLDSLLVSTKKRPFFGEMKNPPVRIHNNNLLGSLLALKLSIIANDSGVTEPYDPTATPLRLLVYYDSSNVSDRFNNLTVQQICNLTDTALTYCTRYMPEDYLALDSCLNRILNAFAGTITVTSMKPFQVTGLKSLSEVGFLHENPAAFASVPRRDLNSALDAVPIENQLAANYPNPFNPTTTVSFSLRDNSTVTIKVYNLLGQEIATLLDQSQMDLGEHAVQFDANNLPSGTYYYRILATNAKNGSVFTDVKKMTLIR